MNLGNPKTIRQKNISKSMETIINKLYKQQEKLDNLVKLYSNQQHMPGLSSGVMKDFSSPKKGRSLEQRNKMLAGRKTSIDKRQKLPMLNTKSQQVISPQFTPKFNSLPEVPNERSKEEFLARSSLQRESLSHKQFIRKKERQNPFKKYFSSRQQNPIKESVSLQQQIEEQGAPTSLEDYFADFSKCIQSQVKEEIDFLVGGYMNSNKKEKLICMLEDHDREIRKLRRKCKHLQYFDTGFFTTDMFN